MGILLLRKQEGERCSKKVEKTPIEGRERAMSDEGSCFKCSNSS